MSTGPIRFGAYQLLNLLPAGGIGTTYLARSMAGGNELVAVKIIDQVPGAQPDALKRLLTKAHQASAVRHAKVISVLAVDRAEGRDFVASEHSWGVTLSELVKLLGERKQRLPVRVAIAFARDLAQALVQVHGAGLVHGAIGPRQVVIELNGMARLAGLGVADAENLLALAEHRDMSEVLGYYAPEQVNGAPTSAATDQFGLGIVLWELCMQQPLFVRPSPGDTAKLLLQGPIAELASVGCPAPLAQLARLMLDRDPARRPRSCTAVAGALQQILAVAGGDPALEAAELMRDLAGRSIAQRQYKAQQVAAELARQAPVVPAPVVRTPQVPPALPTFETDRTLPGELDPDALQPAEPKTPGLTVLPAPKVAAPAPRPAPGPTRHAPRPDEFDQGLIERTGEHTVPSEIIGGDSSLLGATDEASDGAATTYCMSCGAQNDAQSKFCAECGARLDAAPAAPATTARPGSAGTNAGERLVEVDRTTTGASIVMEGGQRYVDFGDEVKTGEIQLSVDHIGPGSGFREGTFCGRSAELTVLRSALDLAVKRGTTQARLIAGTAGIGKTRLLGEAVTTAGEQGFLVAHARGARYGVPLALDVFRQWVIAICAGLAEAPPTADKLAGSSAAEALAWPGKLALPLPLQRRVEQALDGTRHELFHSAFEHRQRMETALLQLLWLAAKQTPLCLIVDGLHRADPVSIRLAQQLTARLPDCQIALFATCAAEHAGKYFAPNERIALGPLADRDAAALAEDFLRHGSLPPDLALALKDGARGNPLLVSHQIRVLLESSILRSDAGEWSLAPVESGQIMTQAKDFTDERCYFLSPGALHTIRVAAIAGETFNRKLLDRACSDQQVSGRQAVDDAMGCGLIVSHGQSREWQSFRMSSIRDHLLADVDASEQNGMRLALAAAYASGTELPPGEAIEARARQLLAVGSGEQAFQATAAAAQKTLQQGCPDIATELFVLALKAGVDLLQPGADVTERFSAQLLTLCEQATLSMMADNPLRAASLLVSVQDRLPREHAPAQRGQALRRRALALIAATRVPDAVTPFAAALKTLTPAIDPVGHASIQAEQTMVQEASGAFDKAIGPILEALKTLGNLSLVGRDDGAELFDFLSRLCCRLGRLYHRMQQPELALKAAQRARDVAKRSDLPLREVSALQLQAGLQRSAGRTVEAFSLLTEAQAIAEEICDPWLQAQLEFELGRMVPDPERPRAIQLLRHALHCATLSGQDKIVQAAREALAKLGDDV